MRQNSDRRYYDPIIELGKGAVLTVFSYDKSQRIEVTSRKATVAGKAGAARISGLASGYDRGSPSCLGLRLSSFRYMLPDGNANYVPGWRTALDLKAGQTAMETADLLATGINAGTQAYKAAASGRRNDAELLIIYTGQG